MIADGLYIETLPSSHSLNVQWGTSQSCKCAVFYFHTRRVMNEFIAFEPKGPCGNDQVGADQKLQQASPPHVKDWLKREEILSLFAIGS